MRSRPAESTVNSEVLHASQLLKWGRAFTVSSDSAFDLDALHGTALFDTERDCRKVGNDPFHKRRACSSERFNTATDNQFSNRLTNLTPTAPSARVTIRSNSALCIVPAYTLNPRAPMPNVSIGASTLT